MSSSRHGSRTGTRRASSRVPEGARTESARATAGRGGGPRRRAGGGGGGGWGGAGGVRGMRLRKDDRVVSMALVKSEETELLTVLESGYGKRTRAGENMLTRRRCP